MASSTADSLSSHHRLLLSAAALPAHSPSGESFGYLLRQPSLDWRRVISEAIRHGVAQKLYREIVDSRGERHVPTWAIERLAAMYAANERRNFRLLKCAERLSSALNQKGLRHLLLKGSALIAAYYERSADRNMADVDLLVGPADFEAALLAGVQSGFDRFPDTANPLPIHQALILTVEEDILSGTLAPDCDPSHSPDRVEAYRHRAVIEVHRGISRTPDRLWYTSDLAPFWETAESAPLPGGAKVGIPGPEAMLVHLGIHTAYHGFCRLMFLMDIALVSRKRRSGIDWARFHEIALATGLPGHIRQSLHLARTVAAAPIPEEAIERLTPYSLRTRLATIREVFSTTMDNPPRVWWTRLRDWPDRMESARALARTAALVPSFRGSASWVHGKPTLRTRAKRFINLLHRFVKSCFQH